MSHTEIDFAGEDGWQAECQDCGWHGPERALLNDAIHDETRHQRKCAA